MKKLLSIVLLLMIILFPSRVLAAGSINVSTRQININKGGAGSFSVVADNAVGKITVTSSNPSVASISIGEFFLDNNSQSITVTGNAAGSAYITVVTSDAATYDEEVITSTFTISVNVTEPTPSVPQQPIRPTTPTVPTETKSNNNELEKIMVNGLEATKNTNEYVIEFSNYVDKVNIVGTARDAKATISEVGEKSLNIGDNNFSITVTAESGTTATYWLNVKRGEYNYLDDLPELLNISDKIEIKLNSDDTLSKETIERISKSGKTVTLNKYDDKFLLYSWILDGKEIKDIKNFNPNIETKANDKIEKTLNYTEGLYLDFTACENIPEGAVLKYNISSKYKKEDVVNIYVYEPKSNTMAYIKKNNEIADDFLEFGDVELNRYFITKAVLDVKDYDLSEKSLGALVVAGKGSIIPIILSGVFGLSTIGLIVYIIISKNRRKIVVSDVDVLDTSDVGIPIEIKQEGYSDIEHLSADVTPALNNEKEEEIKDVIEEVSPPLKTDTKEVLKEKNDDLEDFAKTISLELDTKDLKDDMVKPALKKEEHKEINPLNSKYKI